LQETKDARIMTEAGREMKVWIETTRGVFGKRQVSHLEDKELRPMGLEIFRDARFTWKLPDDIELTKKKGKVKHCLCMDIVAQDKKILKFRWPIEEVSNSKSVIHRNTGGAREPPKAGSVGALLAERKAQSGGSSSSSPVIGGNTALAKPAPLQKPPGPGASPKRENSNDVSSGSSAESSDEKSDGSSEKKKSGSSASSDSSAESSDSSASDSD